MLNISVLPVAFKDFISHYPEVNLFTAERYRDSIIERCVEHQELGMICVSPLITEFFENIPDEVELIPLKQYPIYIAVSAGHPLADHKSLSIRISDSSFNHDTATLYFATQSCYLQGINTHIKYIKNNISFYIP